MEFFILTSPEGEVEFGTEYNTVDDANFGSAPICSTCGKFIGMREWIPPLRVEIEVTSKSGGDVVFGTTNEVLFSERFVDAYKKDNLIGLHSFKEVEIFRVLPRGKVAALPKYYASRPQYGPASIDRDASQLVSSGSALCQDCKLGGVVKRASRIIIDEKTWNKEDIFFPKGLPGTIVVSKRFSEFSSKNQFTNISLISACDYSFDFYPWEQ